LLPEVLYFESMGLFGCKSGSIINLFWSRRFAKNIKIQSVCCYVDACGGNFRKLNKLVAINYKFLLKNTQLAHSSQPPPTADQRLTKVRIPGE